MTILDNGVRLEDSYTSEAEAREAARLWAEESSPGWTPAVCEHDEMDGDDRLAFKCWRAVVENGDVAVEANDEGFVAYFSAHDGGATLHWLAGYASMRAALAALEGEVRVQAADKLRRADRLAYLRHQVPANEEDR